MCRAVCGGGGAPRYTTGPGFGVLPRACRLGEGRVSDPRVGASVPGGEGGLRYIFGGVCVGWCSEAYHPVSRGRKIEMERGRYGLTVF